MKYVWLYDATRCYRCYKKISVPDRHFHSLSLLQMFVLYFEETYSTEIRTTSTLFKHSMNTGDHQNNCLKVMKNGLLTKETYFLMTMICVEYRVIILKLVGVFLNSVCVDDI